MQLAIVSLEVIAADTTHLMAEMSDGSIVTLSTPYGVPRPTYAHSRDPLKDWKFLTKEQLVAKTQDYNCERKSEVNNNLREYKEQRYGHNYQARGY